MQCLDYPPLDQDALPTQNHQQEKERSQFPLPMFTNYYIRFYLVGCE